MNRLFRHTHFVAIGEGLISIQAAVELQEMAARDIKRIR